MLSIQIDVEFRQDIPPNREVHLAFLNTLKIDAGHRHDHSAHICAYESACPQSDPYELNSPGAWFSDRLQLTVPRNTSIKAAAQLVHQLRQCSADWLSCL